jgi:hypothetical protein
MEVEVAGFFLDIDVNIALRDFRKAGGLTLCARVGE